MALTDYTDPDKQKRNVVGQPPGLSGILSGAATGATEYSNEGRGTSAAQGITAMAAPGSRGPWTDPNAGRTWDAVKNALSDNGKFFNFGGPAKPAEQSIAMIPGGMSRAASTIGDQPPAAAGQTPPAAATGLSNPNYGNEARGVSAAQPQPAGRAQAITDTLTPGKTGNDAVASYVGNQGLVDRFNQQHAGGGINVSLDANKRPVFSGTPGAGGQASGGGTGGGQAIAADPGRSAMDIYRNELAITAEDRANAGPKAGFIANSDATRTTGGQMPAGLSARQQAQFLSQQQQTQAQMRGQDLNYQSALSGQDVQSRGQDITSRTQMRGQDLTAQEAGQRIGLLQSGDQRLSERWNLERPTLEDQAKDARAIREARINIANAITSGDPQAVATERAKAEALGIKFGSDNIHIAPTATTDAQGNVIKGYDVLDASGRKIGGSGGQQAQQQLPPGMTRQVGTSNGKPVYEDQNGKRFIGN